MSIISTLARLVANSGKSVSKGKNPAVANMSADTKHAQKGGVRSGATTAHSRKKGR